MSPSLWKISIAPTIGDLPTSKSERLTRMFSALSETNEAIMRARTRAELFHLVCKAAVHGGQFASTIIALSEPGNDFLRVVAAAGPKRHLQRTVRIADHRGAS